MHYDKCVDWWSLGILMFEMLTGDVRSLHLNHLWYLNLLLYRHLFAHQTKRRHWMQFAKRNQQYPTMLPRMPKICSIRQVKHVHLSAQQLTSFAVPAQESKHASRIWWWWYWTSQGTQVVSSNQLDIHQRAQSDTPFETKDCKCRTTGIEWLWKNMHHSNSVSCRRTQNLQKTLMANSLVNQSKRLLWKQALMLTCTITLRISVMSLDLISWLANLNNDYTIHQVCYVCYACDRAGVLVGYLSFSTVGEFV